MAKLTTARRNALPGSAFAGPDRSFPIQDASHARNALARAHYAENPAAIRAAVKRRYPGIGEGRARGGPVSPGQSYMVGEQGPEQFVPSQPGLIKPHGGKLRDQFVRQVLAQKIAGKKGGSRAGRL